MNVLQLFEKIFRRDAPLSGRRDSTRKRDYEDIRRLNLALLPLLGLGFFAAIWVGWKSAGIGPVLLWCVACLAVGGTVGFLFGIPRASKDGTVRTGANEANGVTKADNGRSARSADAGRPNTNLEEVSDWLTKIIVGLTLVNLGVIEQRVMAISRNAAASLYSMPSDADISAATALVVGFSVIGFLCGYLYTRLFLQGAFGRSDIEMRKFYEVVEEELSNTAPEARPESGQPSIPSQSDRQAAERILKVAPSDRPDEVLAPLRALAAEYEMVRRTMPFGFERTRKMAEIASGMKRLALAAANFIPMLTKSHQPGERLAAVIILQMKFDSTYIEWLAERLSEEPAFVGYQAASALLARLRIVGPPEAKRIKAAVQAAVVKGIEPEVERDRLVSEILKD